MSNQIQQYYPYLKNIHLPEKDSHKGHNGKLLIVGGSELFHAASRWSLDVASYFVDMVFYASIPSNNRLVRQAKGKFWNGIVIKREEIPDYIDEADCVLIGPGMLRDEQTEKLVNNLLDQFTTGGYQAKKWVIDAGALQMLDPSKLTEYCILTPHSRELKSLCAKIGIDFETKNLLDNYLLKPTKLQELSEKLRGATLLIKGSTDLVVNSTTVIPIIGGSSGMTKGGTGDVLSGLVAALYSKTDSLSAAVVGSLINKKAGESLHQKYGPFFNADELLKMVPSTLWSILNNNR